MENNCSVCKQQMTTMEIKNVDYWWCATCKVMSEKVVEKVKYFWGE